MESPEVRSVCVFGGAATGSHGAFAEAAGELGRSIAGAGFRLVFGGGGDGMMGAVSAAALAAGGDVVGVIPDFLLEREHVNAELPELEVVADMHERKRRMFDLSDAFVTLPGGIGTLDETMEMMTWRQLGRHRKPIVLINVLGYWDPFRALVDGIVDHAFWHGDPGDTFDIVDSPQAALGLLAAAGRG